MASVAGGKNIKERTHNLSELENKERCKKDNGKSRDLFSLEKI